MRNIILAMIIAPCALWACGETMHVLDKGHQVSDIGKCYDDCKECQKKKVVDIEKPFVMECKGHRFDAIACADLPFLLEYEGHLWIAIMLEHHPACGCNEDLEHIWTEEMYKPKPKETWELE